MDVITNPAGTTKTNLTDTTKTVKAYVESTFQEGRNIRLDEYIESGQKLIVISAFNDQVIRWEDIVGNISDNEELSIALDSKIGIDDIINGGDSQ